MAPKLLSVAVCVGLCALAAGARADLYRWTDAQGRVHVTDDRSQVPRGATVTVQPTGARPATSVAPPAAPVRGAAQRPSVRQAGQAPAVESHQPVLSVEPSEPAKRESRVHVLRFQRAGQEISLDVALADRIRCDFKVDTGASLNTIPAWAVQELGIEIDADTP